MQDYELDAFLGPAAGDVTTEQRDLIRAASAQIDERWTDPDLGNLREAALNAAAQVILGDVDLTQVGADYARARQAEREAMAALTGALMARSRITPTMSERDLAEASGVTRVTVRRALGK